MNRRWWFGEWFDPRDGQFYPDAINWERLRGAFDNPFFSTSSLPKDWRDMVDELKKIFDQSRQ